MRGSFGAIVTGVPPEELELELEELELLLEEELEDDELDDELDDDELEDDELEDDPPELELPPHPIKVNSAIHPACADSPESCAMPTGPIN